MTDDPSEFDPESREEREIGGDAATDRSDFLGLMGHTYRGELDRMTTWRARIDKTTNWAVVVTATLLTWAFSSDSRPHYILLIGTVLLTIFLWIEVRRYRTYDVWRSRVRLLEENVFANALDPEGVVQSNWRELLSDDLREPTIKISAYEAMSRRLRRVFFPLISVMVGAWVVRLAVFGTADNIVSGAAVGAVEGRTVLIAAGMFYGALLLVTFWPSGRQAKGELESEPNPDEWK